MRRLAFAYAAIAAVLSFAPAARGASYLVNSNLDTIDGSDGVTTLREALTAAAASDVISLQIGTQTIAVTAPLPPVPANVVVFGQYTVLDGTSAGIGVDGLTLGNGATVVRMTIIHFGGAGIRANGCFDLDDSRIGVDAADNAAGNLGDGIVVTTPCGLDQGFITNSTISSNGGDGIRIDSGIRMGILGSFIGTTSGGLDRGNGGAGVRLSNGASENSVGSASSPNTIAFNAGPGIVVEGVASDHNPFFHNLLFGNGGLGIDLGNDGVTANDGACDADAGPNRLLNYPELASALLDDAGNTVISGVMNGPSFATMTLEFFETPGVGETSAFLGTANVQLDATCTSSFAVTIPAMAEGTKITASGYTNFTTSELWPSSVTVIGGPEVSTAFAPAAIGSGETSTISVTITNPRPVPLAGVALTDTLPAGLPPVAAAPSTVCSTGTLSIAGSTVTLSGGTIPANDSCTFSFDVVPPLAGSFVHTIDAGAVTATGAAPNDTSASATLTVTSRPRIAKTFQSPTMPVGDSQLMTIEITNADSTSAGNVTVTDVYPAGLVNANPSGVFWNCPGGSTLGAAPDAGGLSMSGATVPANATCTLSVMVTAVAPGTYTNTLAPEDVTFNAGAPAMTGASATVTAYARPTATKSFSPATMKRSGTSTLTIEITNPASIAVTGVTVTDAYPAGMINVSPASGSATCGTLTFPDDTHLALSGGTMAPGGTCTITAIVQALPDAFPSLTNVLQRGDVTTAETGGIAAPVFATLTLNQGLEIQDPMHAVPEAIHPGEPSMIDFSVVNPNASTVTGVEFHHTFSAELIGGDAMFAQTFGCGPATIAITPSDVTVTGGTIAPFGTCLVMFAVTSPVAGTHVETFGAGELTSNEADPNTLARTVALQVAGPPTVSESFGPATTGVGQESILRIDLGNPSDTYLNGVTFTQTLPTGLTIANPAGWGCVGTITAIPGTDTITLTGGVLNPQWTCTLLVPVVASAAGTYTTSSGPVATSDAGTNTDGASASLVVLDPPLIAKTFDPPSIAFGQTSVLTVTLTNPNASPIDGAGFTDVYPAGIVNAGAASTTCAAGIATTASGPERLQLTGGTIPANSSCVVTVAVGATNSGTRTNFIPALGTTSDAGPATTDASASLVIAAAATLPVSMSFDPPSIVPGGTSRLTITVGNGNAIALSGLSIADYLPPTISIANAPNAATTCGGALTAIAGTAIIQMTGGTLAANGTCSVEVDVTGAVPGHWVNEVGGSNILSTTPFTTGEYASATLDVMDAIGVFKGFNNPTMPLGVTFAMTIFISNPNAVAVTGLAFSDVYPAGLVNAATPVHSNACGGTLTAEPGAASLSLSGGTMAPGTGCDVVIEVVANAPGTLTNTIAANAVTTDNTPPNASAAAASVSVVAPGPPTVTLLTYSPTGRPNEPIYVDLQILNPNPTPLTNIGAAFTYSTGFTNLLPPSTTCGGSVSAAEGTNAMSFTGGTLAPFMSCMVTLVVQAPFIGPLTFEVPAGAVTTDAGPTTAPSSVEVLILAPPEISVSFDPASIFMGQRARLTIDVINPNAVPIEMSFQDVYPSGLVNVMPATTTSSCGGAVDAEAGALFLTGGTVPANAQCSVTVLVTAPVAGTYVNTIPTWYAYSQDAGSPRRAATATLAVAVNADIPTASDSALIAMAFLLALVAWRALKG